MDNKKKICDYYELRQGGEVLCASTVPNLGYPPETLRQMWQAGIRLYKNGNRVKLCELT